MKQYEIRLKNDLNICMNDCRITDCFSCKKCSYQVVGEGQRFVKYFGEEDLNYQDIEEQKMRLEVFDGIALNRVNFIPYMQNENSNYQLIDMETEKTLYSLDMDMAHLYEEIEARVETIWPYILNEVVEEEKQKKIGTR